MVWWTNKDTLYKWDKYLLICFIIFLINFLLSEEFTSISKWQLEDLQEYPVFVFVHFLFPITSKKNQLLWPHDIFGLFGPIKCESKPKLRHIFGISITQERPQELSVGKYPQRLCPLWSELILKIKIFKEKTFCGFLRFVLESLNPNYPHGLSKMRE